MAVEQMSERGQKKMREIVVGRMKGEEKLGKCPVERPMFGPPKKVLQSGAALGLNGLGDVSHVGYGGACVISWEREYVE